MKVSIIIPANRDRGYLDEAIQSAMDQDFEGSYEIILASDGNPALQEYADRYGIRFSLAPRKNLSLNQNTAMKIAEGDFIKGLAEDDMLDRGCLRNLYEAIGDNDLVYARAINFKKDGSYTVSMPPQPFNPKALWASKSSFIHGGTTMFRRDVFNELGGRDESINTSEDMDFYLNLLSHGHTFTYCPKVVYYYRIHGEQKSSKDITYRRKVKDYIYNKYKPYFEKL